jgi:hypothetical protein
MRIAIIIGLLAASVSVTPASAEDFDWQDIGNQKKLVTALSTIGGFCATMGFTRPPSMPTDTMMKKLDAYLRLKSSPDFVVDQWGRIVHDFAQMTKMADDKALIKRGTDAMVAAVNDPDSYAQAEKLYVDTVIAPLRAVLSACQRGAADEFIGKHFVSGEGSVRSYEQSLKKDFADGVADLKKYDESLQKQPTQKK